MWTLFRLLLWKFWLLSGMAFFKMCRCAVDQEDYDEMWHNVLYNWSDLFQRWRGSDAGRYYIFRLLAVVLTLVSVGLAALWAKTLVEEEVSTVIDKFDLYRHQVTSLANAVQRWVPELEQSVPRQFQNQTAAFVHNMEDGLACCANGKSPHRMLSRKRALKKHTGGADHKTDTHFKRFFIAGSGRVWATTKQRAEGGVKRGESEDASRRFWASPRRPLCHAFEPSRRAFGSAPSIWPKRGGVRVGFVLVASTKAPRGGAARCRAR